MKKARIYTVICSYNINGNVVNIELSKMLKRLNIQSESLKHDGIVYGKTNGADEVIKYNVRKGYKVKYIIGIKSNNIKDCFDFDYISSNLLALINDLNEAHDYLIERMSFNEFKLIYNSYGNNYLDQLKRRIKNE